ncbi:MAG: Uma2 family endonuclease [Deltaproteobacteria bacterium]|nr:Uma2 family endonuclease [Deltaproteobacteria bacterium]
MVTAEYRLRNFYIYDDLATFPDDGKRREIIDGDLVVNAAPVPRHQRVSRNLQRILDSHLVRSGQGELFNAPIDVRLGEDVFEPDLLVVVPGAQARVAQKYIEGPPALVVEILSPSSSEWDRGRKATAYARHGIREYWILDPDRRLLERFVLRNGAYARDASQGSGTVETPLLPGLRVPLEEVWAD